MDAMGTFTTLFGDCDQGIQNLKFISTAVLAKGLLGGLGPADSGIGGAWGYLEMGVSRSYPQIYPLIPPAAGAL